jgi:predicted Zn-dependent protease
MNFWKNLLKKVGLYKRPSDRYDDASASYWPKNNLTVWYNKADPSWQLFKDALDDWRATFAEVGVTFTETDNRDAADIECCGFMDFSGGAGQDMTGWTNSRNEVAADGKKTSRRVKSQIFLNLLKKDAHWLYLLRVLKHEWGHAWGIDKHFPDDDTLMHPNVPVDFITSTDRNTAKKHITVKRKREMGF